MRIQILRSAIEDLAVGRKFYDRQETGIGDYFFDCLFSEIDSLTIWVSSLVGKAFPLRHLLQDY
jgi:hypothetical protein